MELSAKDIKFFELCLRHQALFQAIMRRHMDKSSVKKRRAALRYLRRRGVSIAELQQVCDMTKRGLEKADRRTPFREQHARWPKADKPRPKAHTHLPVGIQTPLLFGVEQDA